jgi:hypothetical protein
MANKDIYVVRRPYVANGRTLVRRGTRMLGNDVRYTDDTRLMVRADDGLGLDGEVEQATAAPGEKRSVGRPKGSRNSTKVKTTSDIAKDLG